MKLTAEQLVAATGCAVRDADVLADALTRAMDLAIDTPKRVANFLGQTAWESTLYTAVEENLNYRATGLVTTFSKYFFLPPDAPRGRANALAYEHKPEAIANLVYANRMGNGPPESGDGWRRRGRGYIQITGTDNYVALDRDVPALGCLAAPDTLCSIQGAARSAVWFWMRFGCNAPADSNDIAGVTRRINPGMNGLAQRITATRRALLALT